MRGAIDGSYDKPHFHREPGGHEVVRLEAEGR